MRRIVTISIVRILMACGVLLAGLAGCGDPEEEQQALAEYCNPISADHCLLPWPSSFYLKKDAAASTGYRVNYPKEAMPKNVDGAALDPARYNLADGFSIGSQILVTFKSGLSAEGLPTQNNLAGSVGDSCLIWVMDTREGKRVPLFAELDANIRDNEIATLIIRPQVPLKFNTPYAVVLRRGLKDAQGAPLSAPEPFRRIRDGEDISDKTLATESTRLTAVIEFIEKKANISRSDLILAWTFHTASQQSVQGNLLGMVEGALSKLPATGPQFTSVKSTDLDKSKEPNLLRIIDGQMLVPSYLASDASNSWLKLDAKGKPVYRGLQSFAFRVHIPHCVRTASAPLPVLVFGHGLFSTLTGELLSDYHKKLHNRLCMVEVTTRWLGLSELDIADILMDVLTKDFSNLPRITDQIQQANVNMHTLVKLMKGSFLKDTSMQVDNKPVTDGKTLYYLGISNGGIQGVAFSAISRDIERFVFNVSGGWWSLMMQRSNAFYGLSVMLERRYPSALDRLLLISLSQHLWDYTDPISFAAHPLTSPLPGRKKKQILMQEAKDDEAVPNLATRGVARALGLPALTPAVEEVYGLPQKSGPLDSAYVQWNTDPPVKPPGTNVPAPSPKPEDSGHEKVRTLESCIKQLEAFFKPDGKVVHTCDGPCNPD